jgi:DNA-binding transcriptional MerR regulator
MLTEPRYTQPEVLQVTGLKAPVLQTWVNRGAIRLSEQNPGIGRRRLYSALDVVKLAIMRRMADLSIDLSVSKEIAEAAVKKLSTNGEMDWNLYISLRPGARDSLILSAGGPLSLFSPRVGDTIHMRVSEFVEPFEGTGLLDRRECEDRFSERRPINPERRETLARAGVHAEPVIIFPLGEVVNGAIAQLRAIDEEASS